MNRQEFADWERRIAARAEHLWIEAGCPEGPRDRFIEAARELVSIEENPHAGALDPDKANRPVIEEAVLLRNLGEFPTLTDQGDEQNFPQNDDEKPSA